MMEEKPLVLVAGIGRGPYEELAPVLARHKLEVLLVATPEKSIELSHAEKVDLVVLGAQTEAMSLQEVIWAIRSGSSVSRNTSLLVLAQPETADAARRLIDRGVNRVMLLDDPPEIIAQGVADLLNIAPRAKFRFSTRLLVEVADGSVEALGAVVNMSATGLLVETYTDFEPGQHVVLSIDSDDEDEPLSAKAEVVRQAHPERDGVEVIGLRFLSFAGDTRKRLDTILDDAFEKTPH